MSANNYLRVCRRDGAGSLRESAVIFFDDRDPEQTKDAIGRARLLDTTPYDRVIAYRGDVEYRRLGDRTREVLSVAGYGVDGIVGHSSPREVAS